MEMAAVLAEDTGFKLANIVLTQRKSFTLDELLVQIRQSGLEANEITLKRSLSRLCDNGIIIKHGSVYSVALNDL
jgi:Fe2+ or Zn2+ uptake regulation protein